jgi:hypothetical protein
LPRIVFTSNFILNGLKNCDNCWIVNSFLFSIDAFTYLQRFNTFHGLGSQECLSKTFGFNRISNTGEFVLLCVWSVSTLQSVDYNYKFTNVFAIRLSKDILFYLCDFNTLTKSITVFQFNTTAFNLHQKVSKKIFM